MKLTNDKLSHFKSYKVSKNNIQASSKHIYFKYTNFSNYSFKNSTILIFNELITQLFIKNLLINVQTIVNVFLILKQEYHKQASSNNIILLLHSMFLYSQS